ncbi:sulfatase [Polyangium spumosum]|uniref:Sulfatase-like hydrolase/transferase n=1 Tax=Polyangium spumosum TaxID=889282 RepID=A0A6N7PSY6_9BACT|nr:sulfatase [Polyangium spumosum]MRG95148.1 sulfatase-like hydrolase/transferase [Polyangium spumosum]
MTTSPTPASRTLLAALAVGTAGGLGATAVDAALLVLRSRTPPAPLREVAGAIAAAGAVHLGAGLLGGLGFALAALLARKFDPASAALAPDSPEGRARRVDRVAALLLLAGLSFVVITLTNRATMLPATLKRHAFVAAGVVLAAAAGALVFGLARRAVAVAWSFLAPRRWALLALCAAGELAAIFAFLRAPHAQQTYVALLAASFSLAGLACLATVRRIPRAAQMGAAVGGLAWVVTISMQGTSARAYHLLRMGRTLPAAVLRELPSVRPEPFADDVAHAVTLAMTPPPTTASAEDKPLPIPTGSTERTNLPDIVLVTIDTLRADRLLGPAGLTDVHMPALAAFAAEGVVFRNAFAAAPATIGAVTQIMTGKHQRDLVHLSVRSSVAAPLSPDTDTLARRLGAVGYETLALVGGRLVSYYPSVALGFSRVLEDSGPARAPLRAPDIVDAFTRIASRPDRRAPLFAWLHFMEPHDHAMLPAPIPAGYAAAVRLVDAELGRLFAFLRASPRWSATTLLVLADHGEGLGERGLVHHGLAHPLHITIPFVARFPGIAPHIEPAAVSHLDVAPTLLAAAGASARDLPGRPLQHEGLSSRPIFFENVGYAETSIPVEMGVVELPWFYSFDVRARRSVLVDLDADPAGLSNLADERADEAARLAKLLAASLRARD